MLVTREDSFRGTRIHTIVSPALDTPCWPASEVEEALDAEGVHLGGNWIQGIDHELLDGDDAFQLYEALGKRHPGERPLPAVVLLPTGVTLACMDRAHGPELRRLLLGQAMEEIQEVAGRDRLERELQFIYREEELEDRSRRASILHRAVEAARRGGHLREDDAGYAECMASIAEIATGIHFGVRAPVEERVAERRGTLATIARRRGARTTGA
jgi:hypothetical protein